MANITIKDIARKCNVAISTVSRAINNHPDINQETKQLILNVIKEMNYVPNNSARYLGASNFNAICVLVKGLGNHFFSEMIQEIEKACFAKNYSCIIQHVDEHEDELDAAIMVAKEKRLKGIVFLGGSSVYPRLKLAQLNIPFVLSSVRSLDQKVASVSVDDELESYLMTKYLLENQHQRIAMILGNLEEISISKLRISGYRKALNEFNIQYDPNLIIRMGADDRYNYETGYRLTNLLLKQTEFSAIFSTSDEIALGAIRCLYDHHIQVPQDVSVCGFDGIEIGNYTIPKITTVKQPTKQMGEETMKLLFAMIEEKQSAKQVLLKGELLIRESTSERKK